MKWLQGFWFGARFLVSLIWKNLEQVDEPPVKRGRRVVHERYFDEEGNVRWRPKRKKEEEKMEFRK